MANATSKRPRRGLWAVVLVALVLVAAAIVINAQLVDEATRPPMARDGGTIVDTDVVRANVKIEGTGPPIVMIHGFSAAMDWWDQIAPDLARDHRVIRVDLIGHGGSEAPLSGYTIENQAALVAAVLARENVDRVTVIAHSMGGEVATALAEASPGLVERMILIDSPAVAETRFSLGMRMYLTPFLGEAMSRFVSDGAVRVGLEQGFAPNFAIPEPFVDDVRQLTYTAFRSAHENSIAFRTAKATYERLAALNPVPPLLVISGAEDQIVPVVTTKFYESVPGARIEVVQGSGHSPMVEKPAETLKLIRSFLPTTAD